MVVAEGRAALATAAARNSGSAATAVRASAGTNGGYSRWFPAASFLPAAGITHNDTPPVPLIISLLQIFLTADRLA